MAKLKSYTEEYADGGNNKNKTVTWTSHRKKKKKERSCCRHMRIRTTTRCRRLTDILNAEMESFTTMRKKATDIAKP
jgi:hypothetical protein